LSDENEKKEEIEQTDSERDLAEQSEEPLEVKTEETTADLDETEEEEEQEEEPIKLEEESIEPSDEPLAAEESTETIEEETESASEEGEALEAEITEKTEEKAEQEFTIPEIPTEEEQEEVTPIEAKEISEELSIPEIPSEEAMETEEEEIAMEVETLETEEIESTEEELEAEDYGFEAKKAKPSKKRKKKGMSFALSTLIGLGLALLVEFLFSIPLWMGGVGRPDLFYIELVLMLIVMTIPGLFTRSIQKGVLGAFLIFIVSFASPLLLSILGLKILLSPLTPLFASTDFSLDAFQVFKSLFTALDNLPIEQIQKWIWIVDLVLMFILVIFVVVIGTALIKSITKKKKKAGIWIAIPLLSVGLIIFAIFTPIIFSSTYGIIQASTSFLAGSAKMQQAYGVFEESGSTPSTQAMEWIQNNLTEANYWLNISQVNYQGLKNIGIINIAIMLSGQYGPLIEAGDQLALATLAMTGLLLPLFTGIYDLTQSLHNATDDMANFGSSSSSSSTSGVIDDSSRTSIKSLAQAEELKASIIKAIQGLDRAEEALNIIQQRIAQQDIQGSFDEVKEKLKSINVDILPAQVKSIIEEIRNKLDQFDGQLEGFVNFISYTADNLEPTKKILWTAYNTIVGNEYLKLRQFNNATKAFTNAYGNVTSISGIATYTPSENLSGIFAVQITEEFTLILNDLVQLMTPLLQEEIAFAQTYDSITKTMRVFAAAIDISHVNYSSIQAPIALGQEAEMYGGETQIALDFFRANIQDSAYGTMFTKVGVNFDKILTDDFRPQSFGNTTKFMAEIVDYYLISCESYSNQYFTEAINNITIADSIMTNDLLPLLLPDDPRYLQDYYNNWSLALGDIKTKMELYDTPGEYAAGLTDIQTSILNLYNEIEEK